MIFVTGPLYSGKKDYVCQRFGWSAQELSRHAVWDVQQQAAQAQDLDALCEKLAAFDVVIATEVGGGIVPVDKDERAAREAAGRLACLLAQRAEQVVRVFCGIPTVLKGEQA